MACLQERIIHMLDPSSPTDIPLFLPLVSTSTDSTRPLLPSEIDRVMDYPNLPDPPSGLVRHGEAPGCLLDDSDPDDAGILFPKRTASLKAGYVFLCTDRHVAAIPLEGSKVELPPGGRRVFREHAHTDARRGYEMAICVREGGKCFLVVDTLGHRETWAAAIRMRSDVGSTRGTLLRPGGIGGSRLLAAVEETESSQYHLGATGSYGNKQKHLSPHKEKSTFKLTVGEKSGNEDLDKALEQFGHSGFQEEKWLHTFLQKHSVTELAGECEKLDKWINVIKNGLRGAVLEQYEYFVEASREMSKMGREVAGLRTLVERQQETLMSMKNIDFGAGIEEMCEDAGAGEPGDEEEEFGLLQEFDEELNGSIGMNDEASSMASSSSEEDSNTRTPMRNNIRNRRKESRATGILGTIPLAPLAEEAPVSPIEISENGQQASSYVEIPAWISDVTEEISALIKESRYTDAADLILKAKAEICEILSSHEQSTPPVINASTARGTFTAAPTFAGNTPTSTSLKKIHKKQQTLLNRITLQINLQIDRMSKRLAENLRRKNEALKASAKRERADPLSTLAPLPSPICLNDDAVALQLLVKLGKYHEAATAFASRRSVLLSECLHERPISSPVGMDSVIYAAQLSASFFSSLAMSVEGFLDLFLDSDTGKGGSDDDTSLNSRSLLSGVGGKNVPSGALSAIVLWSDSELTKFTNVFGSSRLLGSLALSPPGMRQKDDMPESKLSSKSERERSIEIAAKCIDQAFSFASENLDSIGLPLIPSLGKNIRARLKGCEAEIAVLLDPRWKGVAYEWTLESNSCDRRMTLSSEISNKSIPIDDRRL